LYKILSEVVKEVFKDKWKSHETEIFQNQSANSPIHPSTNDLAYCLSLLFGRLVVSKLLKGSEYYV